MEGMKTRHLLFWTFVATLVTAALHLYPNYGFPVGDTFIMQKAHLTPRNETFAYWWDVFSRPNHGPQYRPVGFFAYFWVMGKLFDASLASLAVASYLFFAWSLGELLLLCRRLGWGRLSMLGVTAVMVLHPVTSNILDQSFAMKYQFTLAVLIHGMRLMMEKEVPPWRWVLLYVLAILVGLSQEGAIVFPFIWLLWDWARHRTFRYQHLFFFALVALYGLAKLTYLRMPIANDFMRVSLPDLPMGASYYLHVIFSPLLGIYRFVAIGHRPASFVWLVAPLFFLGVGVYASLRRQWLPLFCGVAAVALVAPYAGLVNHISFDRAYWGLLPAALLVGWLLSSGKKWIWAIAVVILVGLGTSFRHQNEWNQLRLVTMREIGPKVAELVALIGPRPGETIAIFFTAPKKLTNDWINFYLVTGAMSHAIPKDTTVIINLDGRNSVWREFVLLKDGIKYFGFYLGKIQRSASSHQTTFWGADQFQVRHSFLVDVKWDREFNVPVLFPNE